MVGQLVRPLVQFVIGPLPRPIDQRHCVGRGFDLSLERSQTVRCADNRPRWRSSRLTTSAARLLPIAAAQKTVVTGSAIAAPTAAKCRVIRSMVLARNRVDIEV